MGEPYDYPAERILVKEIDWDKVNFGYDGEVPEYARRAPEPEEITVAWRDTIMERCAWYRSFHYRPLDYWGIHFNQDCWIRIADRFFRHAQYGSWGESLKGAFMYLFLHEFFHYITDLAASTIEILSGNPYVYDEYSRNVYTASFPSVDCIEEALANRYLYGRAESVRLHKDYLYASLEAQPPCYQLFNQYLGANFWKGRRLLTNQIKEGMIRPSYENPLENVIELLQPWHYSHGYQVPLWLHIPPRQPIRIFVR